MKGNSTSLVTLNSLDISICLFSTFKKFQHPLLVISNEFKIILKVSGLNKVPKTSGEIVKSQKNLKTKSYRAIK